MSGYVQLAVVALVIFEVVAADGAENTKDETVAPSYPADNDGLGGVKVIVPLVWFITATMGPTRGMIPPRVKSPYAISKSINATPPRLVISRGHKAKAFKTVM